MAINQAMEKYAEEHLEDALAFTRELCVIPAPSHHEEKRCEYLMEKLKKLGAEGCYVDEALNVIWPVNVTEDNDIVVLMAHTDVVFPDTTPLPLRIEGDRYYCPGIYDDTVNVAVLFTAAKYFMENKLKPNTGILFVANSCEEGLGNLKGTRMIVDTFGYRIKEFMTFESSLDRLTTVAVGSHRYSVKVKTEGGHSYGSFGNRNAIRCLADIIETLYSVKVPVNGDSKTTYNVGLISGGTSVNTIAQEAEMLYEYRSTDRTCLAKMQDMFEKVVEAYRATGIEVEVTLLGERPCNGDLDPVAYEALLDKARGAIKRVVAKEARCNSSSTDANYPLSKGIPAICVGTSEGMHCHTREEYLEVSSVLPGLKIALDLMSNYFD